MRVVFVCTLLACLFCACELFNNPVDPDFVRRLDDEVAWANAAKLTVSIAFITEWGTSNPPQGTITPSMDIRRGHSFNLEFVASGGYSFVNWLAFDSNEYNLSLLLMEYEEALALSLNGNGVEVVRENANSAGAIPASITINITSPITLVPFCSDRPAVIQTTPPLINTGRTQSRGKNIEIFFNMPIIVETAKFGPGFIELNAEDLDGYPYRGDGIKYASIIDHFHPPVYDSSYRSITIRPRGGSDLPPGDLLIIVKIGTNITGENKNTLASPVEFSYVTNDLFVPNAYIVENIWAIHKPEEVIDERCFFFQHFSANERDKRLRKNDLGNYEITLYFTAYANNPEEMPLQPNAVDIVYISYSDITGQNPDIENIVPGMKKTIEPIAISPSDMYIPARIYREANDKLDAPVYKVVYTWPDAYDKPEIIRLVVLPYRTGDTEVNPADPLRGSFVTAALDSLHPGGNAVFTLSGEASESNGVYNYSNVLSELTINANFANIADNIGEGVRFTNANANRPWTMDSNDKLQWQFCINGLEWESVWFPFANYEQSIDLSTIPGLSSAITPRSIEVKYRDSLENESSWISTGMRFRFYDTARNVRAIHDPEAYEEGSITNDFFWQGAPLERDRRLRTNNQVTLYFNISGTDPNTLPDSVRIAEIHYAALQGSDINELIEGRGEIDYSITPITDATDADEAYMGSNSDGSTFYRVTHTIASPPAGIIRLAVMPYRSADGFTDTWQAAVDEGRFVTVIRDNLAPGGGANLTMSGEYSRDGNVLVFNPDAKTLAITANFTGITDNSGTGIPFVAATQNKPWTMDEQEKIQWQYGFGINPTAVTGLSDWFSLSVNQESQDLSALGITNTVNRNVYVRYRDSLLNTSDWVPMGEICYDQTALDAISEWGATYNESNNSIDLTWTRPGNAKIEIRVDGVPRGEYTGATSPNAVNPYRILLQSAQKINSSLVRSGQPVSNVIGYNVSLVAVYPNGISETKSFKIWNIPGMEVSSDITTKEINSQEDLTEIMDEPTAQYVLTSDIRVSSHTPIGTHTNPFMGKFFGNGNTITIDGWAWGSGNVTAGITDIGLFGFIDGGVVRDLTVEYNCNEIKTQQNRNITILVDNNGTTNMTRSSFGGITGTASGNAHFENILMKGEISYSKDSTSPTHSFIGGIAGVLTGASKVSNAYSSLNITAKTSGSTTGSIILGGVAGAIGDIRTIAREGSGAVIVEEISVTGNITVGSIAARVSIANSGDGTNVYSGLLMGGLAGNIHGESFRQENNFILGVPAQIKNSEYRDGRIMVYSGLGSARIGGAIGRVARNVEIENISARAEIFEISKIEGNMLFIGGFVGEDHYGIYRNCYSDNPIIINTGVDTVRAGGFAGGASYRLSYCFAKGDVSVTSTGIISAGGFVGYSYGVRMLYNYASGNVSVVSTGDFGAPYANLDTVNAGGFAGSIYTGNIQGVLIFIQDCYALGNVFVDKTGPNGNINAGGFFGTSDTITPTLGVGQNQIHLARCFSAGSVIAQRSTAGAINAGGFMGKAMNNASTVRYCAALGSSVTTSGNTTTGTLNIGRIWGLIASAIAGYPRENNYAFSGMALYRDTTYAPFVPPTPVSPAIIPSHNGQHGTNAHIANFSSSVFWNDTLMFNKNPTPAISGLESALNAWDFSMVGINGYPRLRCAYGNVLGGQ